MPLVRKPKLIVRDRLAIDRTLLANERTFLAYLRTVLTALITGVSFVKFFPGTALETVGWALFPTAGLIFLWGIRSAIKTHAKCRTLAE